MTPQQLQHLRDTGHGWAADEIDLLRKENAELRRQLAKTERDCDAALHQVGVNYEGIVAELRANDRLKQKLAEAQKQNERGNAALAVIEYVLEPTTVAPYTFIHDWYSGKFKYIRDTRPDVPETIFPKE